MDIIFSELTSFKNSLQLTTQSNMIKELYMQKFSPCIMYFVIFTLAFVLQWAACHQPSLGSFVG